MASTHSLILFSVSVILFPSSFSVSSGVSECTYSHFERSSQCPTCGRRLAENDFTELVVADANTGTDVVKSNMQSLLTKKHSGGMLQYSEICQSLIRQVDSTKQATKFLLKQLLLESHKSGRNNLMASRTHETLQAENTQLKQLVSSQRLQYEQTITTLQNKLTAREATIAEQNKMIDQFRKYHGGGGGSGHAPHPPPHPHMVPNSSSASFSSSTSLGGGAPPLRGLMAQREANKIAHLTKKHSGGMLQYSEICQSLIRQVDSTKQATKFLLKQLLLESHKSGRNNLMASRTHETLQAENTQLKQLVSSQRLQYEQTITTLQNKLTAREATIAEQNKMIDQFRKYHGGGGGSGHAPHPPPHPHMVPNSSSASFSSSTSLGGGAPPLRGLMAQREANKIAQQNTLNGRSRPFMNAMQNSSRSKSPGANFRPFSSGSTEGGSVSSNTPRIRDLSASSGYHFTGMSNHNQPLNKRRRGGTPGSMGTGTPHTAMSPTTAFTLNQGPHSNRPHRF